MTIKEYLDEIFVDERVRIDGKKNMDIKDPFAWHVWKGITKDIPEELYPFEIVCDGWMMHDSIHAIEIFDPEEKTRSFCS